MFESRREQPTTLTIRKVRNGFELYEGTGPYDHARLVAVEPYVFRELNEVMDFLIACDWEITEE